MKCIIWDKKAGIYWHILKDNNKIPAVIPAYIQVDVRADATVIDTTEIAPEFKDVLMNTPGISLIPVDSVEFPKDSQEPIKFLVKEFYHFTDGYEWWTDAEGSTNKDEAKVFTWDTLTDHQKWLLGHKKRFLRILIVD